MYGEFASNHKTGNMEREYNRKTKASEAIKVIFGPNKAGFKPIQIKSKGFHHFVKDLKMKSGFRFGAYLLFKG